MVSGDNGNGNGNGYRAQIEEMYRRHRSYIYGYIRGVFGFTHETAEDLTQEVFLRAFARYSGFEHRSNSRTWLHRIAHNVSTNYLKSERRRPLMSAADIDARVEISSPQQNATKILEAKDLYERIQVKLKELTREHQEALQMHREGLSHKDIASKLGVSIGTSKARLCRARASLLKRVYMTGSEYDSQGIELRKAS